jgi:hypothetical protein
MNEREAGFLKIALMNENDMSLNPDGTYSDIDTQNAWLWYQDGSEHQQKRIDELECSLQNWIDFSKKWERLCKEKDGEIESLQAKCVLLEKQNTVAIEALDKTLANTYALSPKADFIRESLAEINRLQDKPVEGE